MSRHHVEKIICPNCKTESDFLLWDSINTCLDPEMKEKVRNGEVFKWKCPTCGNEAMVEYATLYHQMEDRVMIYYVPGEGDKTETIELMKGRRKNKDGEYVEMDMKFDEGYIKRVVDTKNQFREKLSILDAGLDDRIIELMKIFMLAQLEDKNKELGIEEVLFDKLEDGTKTFAVRLDDGRWAQIKYSQDMYDYFAKNVQEILEEESDAVVVDGVWALEVIKRQK